MLNDEFFARIILMTDINQMWISFEASIPALEQLVTGFAYVLGIGFIVYALNQFHDLADRYTKQAVKGGYFEPTAYLLAGGILLWLPSWISVFEVTLFGSDSPLAYSGYITNKVTILQNASSYAVTQILQFVGILFFVRGITLMALSSSPGVQHGHRGFIFMIGGIMAVNFPATFAMIKATIQSFVTSSHSLYPIQQTIQSFF